MSFPPPTTIEGWPPISTGKSALLPDGTSVLYQPNIPAGTVPAITRPPILEGYPLFSTMGVGIDPDGAVWLLHPPSPDGMVDTTPLPPAPVNTVLPTITIVSGGGNVGSLIANGNPGTWVPPQTGGYTRRWFRGATVIAGATGNSYTATEADVGALIRVGVTALGDGGLSLEALSAQVGPITEPPPPEEEDTQPEEDTFVAPKATRAKRR